ncbi:DNA cytosine methyltransferase [Streptosporangium pseudovulgare]|uniref:Cytosine-specific methyltransferase n=1 Tax=Streptosporangium pseudovulgare TaxID=35765 RepID=A0ABQ2QSA8_9ACTN|nr:DNA cytosine methyltransferase [Streptosporangium pseudovulgare]GGP91084.1 cytosine-specific methyltransferase [Streptosporangium pseudovulgare]
MIPRTTSPINVVDLFAGCGGFTQGFHEFTLEPDGPSPFRTVGAVELDFAAASTYAANFADEAGGISHIHPGDIKDWDPGTIDEPVDVILGGPPCQGFSGLGKEDPKDPRNRLWREYVRVVKALRPKIFVIENVDRFVRSVEFTLLKEATEPGGDLDDYVLEYKILNAADYGVPQARRRAIALVTRRDLIERHPKREPLQHPAATHQKPGKGKGADDLPLFDERPALPGWMPARTVFDLTPHETKTTHLPDKPGFDRLGRWVPGPFRTSELHIGRIPTEHSLLRYAAIPAGGNRHDLPPHLSTKNWINHRTGSGDVMGRMYKDRPSVTIRTEFYKPEKGRYLHPTAHRPITHLEAALLQGFPMDFLWCGSKVEIARQIGNAVPVGLSKAIAGAVYEYLRDADQIQ